MTSFINLAQVSRVLLTDGWHQVADDSFTVETSQFRSSSGNAVSGLGEPVATWAEQRQLEDSREQRRVQLAAPIKQILAIEYEAATPG